MRRSNFSGQLGRGTTEDDQGDQSGEMGDALRRVDFGPGYNATDIAAGEQHTCALLQPGGRIKCWG